MGEYSGVLGLLELVSAQNKCPVILKMSNYFFFFSACTDKRLYVSLGKTSRKINKISFSVVYIGLPSLKIGLRFIQGVLGLYTDSRLRID